MVCVIASAVGHVTPPVGLCLFLGMAISGLPMEKLIKPLVPFLVAIVTVLLIVAFVPETVLFVPPATGLREVTFYLVRHGAAASGPDDRVRPLTREAAPRSRRRRGPWRPVEWTSPRSGTPGSPVRASAEILGATLAPPHGVHTATGLLPEDDPAAAAAELERAEAPLMLVGHLPHLARLSAALAALPRSSGFTSPQARRWGSGGPDGWQVEWVVPAGRAAPASAAPRLRPVRRRGAPRPAFEGCRACAADPPRRSRWSTTTPRLRSPGPSRSGPRGPAGSGVSGSLPPPADASVLTLAEGATPLVRLDGVDGPRIWLKDETRNPTGSFKDRLHAVSLTMARALGFRKAVASTTGNHGTALAAYAARAGMDALVFCDPRAPVVQRRLMQLLGLASSSSPTAPPTSAGSSASAAGTHPPG